MLEILIPETEDFNDNTSTFNKLKSVTLILEHSLISISKYESITNKAFMRSNKNVDDIYLYIKCMTINKVDDSVYERITDDNIADINKYIQSKQSATVITSYNKRKSNKILTSEMIYAMMVVLHIPLDCDKWSLNRLLNLIECVSNLKNDSKMSKIESANVIKKLNEERRDKYKTRG